MEQILPRASRRNQPFGHLGFELLATGIVRPEYFCFKPPGLWYFVTTA